MKWLVNLRGQRCAVFLTGLITGGWFLVLIGLHGKSLSILSRECLNGAPTSERSNTFFSETSTDSRYDKAWFQRRVDALTKERNEAASSFAAAAGNFNHGSGGYLWFYHNQKAGGTTLCSILQNSLKNQTRTLACYLKTKMYDVWTGLQCEESNNALLIRERWKLNSPPPPDDEVQLILQNIENEMKSMGKSMVSSENIFLPRSILHEWIVEGNPFYANLFSKWSFLTTLRDPVKRLESAFYFHDNHFHECRNYSYGLSSCIRRTETFTRGRHRNKLVKELSGFYAPTESGDPNGRFINGTKPTEATQWDLTVAKLVLHRFLPPVIADGTEALESTMRKSFSMLNLTMQTATSEKNKGKRSKVEMSWETMRAIQKLNVFDMALYTYALANFDV